MKKLSLIMICILLGAVVSSVKANNAPIISPAMYDAGAMNAQDMDRYRQRQFQTREYNKYKSIKEIKDEHQKELEINNQTDRSTFDKIINRKTPAKFVEENGKIKIEHLE